MRALCAGIALLVVSSAAAAQPTIRQIDGAPFAATIVASPVGSAAAFVLNERGVRNIYLADSTGTPARKVTAFTQDDGQDLASLTFSSDGRTLYFVRGGAPNRAGESPNPTSDPAGAELAIWRVRLDGSAAARVTEGSAPAPVPGGDGFAFLRRGAVWMATAGGDSVRVAPLFRMRGSAGQLRWSPQGDRLAFVSNRGTHSFVGIYTVAQKTLQWMDPSTDRDGSPVWSPDGTRLAFLREPYERQRMMFVPQRTAQPWSIRVADARTGRSTEIFRAAAGVGSAYWAIVADNQLFWCAGDRIAFAWERTGYLHLYSIPASGGTPQELTPGIGEVEFVAQLADRTQLLYNTNIGDTDRRRVMTVATSGGGAPQALTPGPTIAWNAVASPRGDVFALVSSAQLPAHAARLRRSGGAPAWEPLAPQTMPGDFPERALVTPIAITLRASDGVTTSAQVFLPPAGAASVKRPAVIFLHGGSRRQMLLGWNYGSYYHHAYAFNQAMALQGYVVVSLNYRSGIGYGMAFREALKYGASGASEYRDVVAAAQWLRARSDVDASRIGLWGGSYGGFLTAMGLTRNPELFKAGVDIHGVHDWNVGIATFMPDYDVYEDPAATTLAFTSSPLSQVQRWRAPVLLIHGDDDRNVRFIETLTLIEHLRRQRVTVEQLVFPDEVHGFLRHESWMRAYEAALDFFRRML
jgi:dipeptidyl aminopeptidase/acylaminoacyl peptidase